MGDFRLEMSKEFQAELTRLLTQFNNLLEHVPAPDYRPNFEEVYTDTVPHTIEGYHLECVLKFHVEEEVALLELNVEKIEAMPWFNMPWFNTRIFQLCDTRLAVHTERDDAIRWAQAEIEAFKPQFEESVTNYVAGIEKARSEARQLLL